jgi:hypothetical protein
MTSATVPPPETRSSQDRAEMQDRSSEDLCADFQSASTGACAPGVGLRRRKRRSSVGTGRPLAEGPSRRLKSAFPGAMRQASAFADARNVPRLAQADRWPKAFTPIEIGLPRRDAPGVGLRRREERFSVGAGRPLAKGLRRPNSFGAPRAGRRPPPTQATLLGRRRPTVGQRPHPVEFIRHTGRPSAAGLPRSNSSDAPGRPCSPMGPGRNRRDEADGNGRSV